MARKILILKLAAIGDVALACRALVEASRLDHGETELHWIIDHKLESLARSLLKIRGFDQPIHWHAVDAERLFQGSAREKLRIARQIASVSKTVSPDAVALLHRDWRYRLMLRVTNPEAALWSVTRRVMHELDAYHLVFRQIFNNDYPPKQSGKGQRIEKRATRIGVLLGGARNQKTDYREKRWPLDRWISLLRRIASIAGTELALFGGPDDAADATRAIQALGLSSHRLKNHVGKLSLAEIPTELRSLDAFLSVDSGLAHIASMAMTEPHQKIITLFGPTDPLIWAPRASGSATAIALSSSQPCSPCYGNDGTFRPCVFRGERFQLCMTALSEGDVLAALSLDSGLIAGPSAS